MTEHYLHVAEQFYSVQGESTWAGKPCLFIRLAGCNLRCTFCDAKFTWEEQGNKVSVQELLKWTNEYPGTMVELTGGEPLLQEEVYYLVETLLVLGRTVLIETNGSVSIQHVPSQVHIIMDIKCPESGMESKTDWENIEYLRSRAGAGSQDEIKFVISSLEDFYWAKEIFFQYQLDEIGTVLFSANERSFEARELAGLILQHRLQVRLQIQLHKLLWPELDRGV